MNDPYQDQLIHGHLDDLLDESERAEFARLMRDSDAARRRFWELAEVHGLARDAARLAWPDAEVVELDAPAAARSLPACVATASRTSPLRALRPTGLVPAGLVAAGLLLGVMMTGLAWAMARPAVPPIEVLFVDDFESDAKPLAGGLPTTTGLWSGDFTEIVAAQSGIQPAGGRRMLRFLRADYEGKPNVGGYISEIYRLIDVRDRRGQWTDGEAIVQVSARFNAAPQPQELFHASLAVYAFDAATLGDGRLRSGPELVEQAEAVTRRSNLVVDADTSTWQRMSTDLRLPPNTDFLLVRIAMAHAPPTRDAAGHETFAAHFADDVRIVLTRRPFLP